MQAGPTGWPGPSLQMGSGPCGLTESWQVRAEQAEGAAGHCLSTRTLDLLLGPVSVPCPPLGRLERRGGDSGAADVGSNSPLLPPPRDRPLSVPKPQLVHGMLGTACRPCSGEYMREQMCSRVQLTAVWG